MKQVRNRIGEANRPGWASRPDQDQERLTRRSALARWARTAWQAGPAAVLTPVIALAAAALLALTLTPPRASAASDPAGGQCATGQLCLWTNADFEGTRRTYELSTTGTGDCVPLPAGATAESLANRMGRPVTTYQSRECAETGEFETYPGGGVWLPRSSYLIRAFKVWEG